VIEKLRVIEIVDDVLGARREDAGASVGTYVALAAPTGWSTRAPN
jgi:hypothetical protein